MKQGNKLRSQNAQHGAKRAKRMGIRLYMQKRGNLLSVFMEHSARKQRAGKHGNFFQILRVGRQPAKPVAAKISTENADQRGNEDAGHRRQNRHAA